ncbi:MAG: hypothetical protein MHM6MM_004711 [Cercozoa sp. M6MM]
MLAGRTARSLGVTQRRWRPLEGHMSSLREAVNIVRAVCPHDKPTAINLNMRSHLDTRKLEQDIRTTIMLPFGDGTTKRVALACDDDDADMMEEFAQFGANVLGCKAIIEATKADPDNLPFDVVVATQQHIKKLAPVARALGQRGFMPNKRLGSLVPLSELQTTVESFQKGISQIRFDERGRTRVRIGNSAMPLSHLHGNAVALMKRLYDKKPKGMDWVQSCVISSPSGFCSVRVDVSKQPFKELDRTEAIKKQVHSLRVLMCNACE